MAPSIFCTNEFSWTLLLCAFIAGALVTLGVCWLSGPSTPPDGPGGTLPPRG